MSKSVVHRNTENAESAIIVGLDIGSHKIAAVAGRVNDKGELVIEGVGLVESKGVFSGEIQNIDHAVQVISEAIDKAGQQADIFVDSVNVNVAEPSFRSKVVIAQSIPIEGPVSHIQAQDLERLGSAVQREASTSDNTVLHIMPQYYKVGNKTDVYDPVGSKGTHLGGSFNIITARKESIDNIKDCFDKIPSPSVNNAAHKLTAENYVFSPLASSLAVLEEEEKDSGVAMVDIGCGKTEIVIFHDNIVRYVSVIGIGGDSITDDIATGCSIKKSLAEELKVKLGTALPNDVSPNEVVSVEYLSGRPPKDISLYNLSVIIQERLLEIATMVNAEILRSGFADQLVGGIVLTGGSAMLKGIDKVFTDVTNKHVLIKKPNLKVSADTAHLINNPAFAAAVGLVWRGFGALYPREQQVKSKATEVQAAVDATTKAPAPAPAEPDKRSKGLWSFLKLGREIFIDDIDDAKFGKQ